MPKKDMKLVTEITTNDKELGYKSKLAITKDEQGTIEVTIVATIKRGEGSFTAVTDLTSITDSRVRRALGIAHNPFSNTGGLTPAVNGSMTNSGFKPPTF